MTNGPTQPATRATEAATTATRRRQRVELIRKIEQLRKSRVLTYVCSDRQGAAANIGEDAVRPMYEHVRRMGKTGKIDFYLYSRGGAVEVPWRIVSMLREYCDELDILIPYRAQSAATLIALGCDHIVMGPKAELGPIDPALNRVTPQEGGTPVQEEIRVEDVMSYIGFIREKAGLGDQAAVADNVKILADKLSPWVLGNIYRTHSHIRMVARRMLSSHRERLDDQRASLIVEALAEKIYLHGHGIARSEAKELGLAVENADGELESAMWNLLVLYEDAMQMRRPVDPEALLGENDDEYQAPVTIAMIESEPLNWAFRGELKLRRHRQAPTQININLNLQLALPPGLDPALVPQEVVNDILRRVQGEVPQMVQEQTRRQSPPLKIQGSIRGGYWQDVTDEPD